MAKTTGKAPRAKGGRAGHSGKRDARSGQVLTASFSTKGATFPPGVVGSTRLKKAGGSLVMTVPAAARNSLRLHEGQEMSVRVEGEKLVLEPAVRRPKYTLDELLAQCDFDAPYSGEERAWLDAPPAGRELL